MNVYESLSELERCALEGTVELNASDLAKMRLSREALAEAIKHNRPVYGVTSGYGPLSRYGANSDPQQQGLGLIAHLANGQGPSLGIDDTRLMILLRLSSMRRGFSGISPEEWNSVGDLFRLGFVPVVPSLGSLSASGDLTPLAHAALSMCGSGEAWVQADGRWNAEESRSVLARFGHAGVPWNARSALAFVNGTSASLAVTIRNHLSLARMVRAGASLTGVLSALVGAATDPYEAEVANAKSSNRGQLIVSTWILQDISERRDSLKARTIQEPYSIRCAPQVLGAVADQLSAQAPLLLSEANGSSDNPVICPEGIFHAGNFHAATAGIVSDLHAVLIHQVAFLAERQLAFLVNPRFSGVPNDMLAFVPGNDSGIAGVQLVASSLTAQIRQNCFPATATALPSNLDNQDVVPMSLNSALARRAQIENAWLVLGSLAIGLNQYQHLTKQRHPADVFQQLRERSPLIAHDRPLGDDVRLAAVLLEATSGDVDWLQRLETLK